MEGKHFFRKISKDMKEKSLSIVILALMLIMVLIIILAGSGHAKYMESYKGETKVEVAKMICEMEVEPSEADKSIINPYCKVKVKDYNANGEITETNVNYTIEVKPKDDFKLPEYYWQSSNGTIVSRNSELVGNFKNGVKDEIEYTIVFLNSGEEDILRLVEFNLVAVQAIK